MLNGSDIQFSDWDNDIQKDFAASASEQDEEAIESVTVNKDTVPTKETASKKRQIIWQKKEFEKPVSTWLHDHAIAEANTTIDQTSPVNLILKYLIVKLLIPIRSTVFWQNWQTRGTSKNWKWVQ